MDDTHQDFSPQELFRLAKVEHYLGRADELCRMARYGAASEALERVLTLDRNNATAVSLGEEIDRRVRHLTIGPTARPVRRVRMADGHAAALCWSLTRTSTCS